MSKQAVNGTADVQYAIVGDATRVSQHRHPVLKKLVVSGVLVFAAVALMGAVCPPRQQHNGSRVSAFMRGSLPEDLGCEEDDVDCHDHGVHHHDHGGMHPQQGGKHGGNHHHHMGPGPDGPSPPFGPRDHHPLDPHGEPGPDGPPPPPGPHVNHGKSQSGPHSGSGPEEKGQRHGKQHPGPHSGSSGPHGPHGKHHPGPHGRPGPDGPHGKHHPGPRGGPGLEEEDLIVGEISDESEEETPLSGDEVGGVYDSESMEDESDESADEALLIETVLSEDSMIAVEEMRIEEPGN